LRSDHVRAGNSRPERAIPPPRRHSPCGTADVHHDFAGGDAGVQLRRSAVLEKVLLKVGGHLIPESRLPMLVNLPLEEGLKREE